jgi:hypothetical protein
VLVLAALAMLAACGSSVQRAPERPRPVDPETRVNPERERLPPPRLIAPPPAYGNKVVMAKGPTSRSSN